MDFNGKTILYCHWLRNKQKPISVCHPSSACHRGVNPSNERQYAWNTVRENSSRRPHEYLAGDSVLECKQPHNKYKATTVWMAVRNYFCRWQLYSHSTERVLHWGVNIHWPPLRSCTACHGGECNIRTIEEREYAWISLWSGTQMCLC